VASLRAFSREQRAEKMSRLRQTIARRLVSVKNETAMLACGPSAANSAPRR
jgi:pyruvate/2-oxoglutarate dehydrogenase complex dihydrolipoamide acyltransferase (E2) component